MVVLAMLYTRTFYGLTHLFHRLPVKPHFKPAIGAFLSGLLAVGLYFLLPRPAGSVRAVLRLRRAADAMTPPERASLFFALVLLAVAVGKILTTGLTIGSGGSGGVFGPSMVIGGCGGGALGIFLHWLWPTRCRSRPASPSSAWPASSPPRPRRRSPPWSWSAS